MVWDEGGAKMTALAKESKTKAAVTAVVEIAIGRPTNGKLELALPCSAPFVSQQGAHTSLTMRDGIAACVCFLWCAVCCALLWSKGQALWREQ
jgi:hypothetical protein